MPATRSFLLRSAMTSVWPQQAEVTDGVRSRPVRVSTSQLGQPVIAFSDSAQVVHKSDLRIGERDGFSCTARSLGVTEPNRGYVDIGEGDRVVLFEAAGRSGVEAENCRRDQLPDHLVHRQSGR